MLAQSSVGTKKIVGTKTVIAGQRLEYMHLDLCSGMLLGTAITAFLTTIIKAVGSSQYAAASSTGAALDAARQLSSAQSTSATSSINNDVQKKKKALGSPQRHRLFGLVY